MKQILSIIFILSISLTSASYAYCIYNDSSRPIEVYDSHLGGMHKVVSAWDYACCDPKNFGCRGNVHIKIYNYYDVYDLDCEWKGRLDGKGHYFRVRKLYDSAVSPCEITHYRD